MRVFSDEEFEKMISELDCEKPQYTTLCIIAERVLRPSVVLWCSGGVLKGRVEADDLMQDIHIKLIKKIVTGFLRHKKAVGRINRDPDWFNSWLFYVAKNYTRDVVDEVKRKNINTVDLDSIIDTPAVDDNYFPDEKVEHSREALTYAFNIVLNSDRSVYIVLTWIAQSLLVIRHNLKRPQATDLILTHLKKMRLFDMWKTLLAFSRKIPWMTINPEQRHRITSALCETLEDGRLLGDVKYEEFFMKTGEKKSISDWVNRIDTMIERRMSYEPFDGE